MSFKDPDDFRTRLARRALAGVETVAGPRNKDYGPPREDMRALAEMVTAYLRQRGLLPDGKHIEAHDMAAVMMMVKLCRLAHSPGHDDSITDIIGWDLIYDECFK